MDEINVIAEEFRKFKGEIEKEDRINEIAKSSINTWLKTVMQNQPYTYITSEDENKITLSVKIKYDRQLDIPIYCNRFQKIMPELLETIQQYEKITSEIKVKVLISNSRHHPWIKSME